MRVLLVFLLLTLLGPLWVVLKGEIDFSADYRTANRESANIAPIPQQFNDAIIQAYSARAFNWRGIFATHIWIAVKPKNASQYTVFQVIGWRLLRGLPPVIIEKDIPDRYWFDQRPTIILDIRGEKAERLIPKLIDIANAYPYRDAYEVWPGPNSNTFPAYIARNVPEMEFSLPPNAIGKDFLPGYTFFTSAPSGTGYQFSLFGLLGILLAKKEGIEINFLGLVYGVKFKPFAILLPGVGEISF